MVTAATYTASEQTATPRLNHVGINTAKSVYNGLITLSDTILGVKIPTGATILDGYVSGTIGSATSIIKVGTTAGGNDLLSGNAGSTMSDTPTIRRFDGGSMPKQISLSDDAATRYTWVYITVNTATSQSATSSLTLVVNYVAPGSI